MATHKNNEPFSDGKSMCGFSVAFAFLAQIISKTFFFTILCLLFVTFVDRLHLLFFANVFFSFAQRKLNWRTAFAELPHTTDELILIEWINSWATIKTVFFAVDVLIHNHLILFFAINLRKRKKEREKSVSLFIRWDFIVFVRNKQIGTSRFLVS